MYNALEQRKKTKPYRPKSDSFFKALELKMCFTVREKKEKDGDEGRRESEGKKEEEKKERTDLTGVKMHSSVQGELDESGRDSRHPCLRARVVVVGFK